MIEEPQTSPIPFPVAVLAVVGFFAVAGWFVSIPFGWKVVLTIGVVGGGSWVGSRR